MKFIILGTYTSDNAVKLAILGDSVPERPIFDRFLEKDEENNCELFPREGKKKKRKKKTGVLYDIAWTTILFCHFRSQLTEKPHESEVL